MLAMIKVKKHIDLLPSCVKKEEFINKKVKEFVKLPIKKQREELISEQEKFLNLLDVNNTFILNMVRKEFERDDFIVEPYSGRKEI